MKAANDNAAPAERPTDTKWGKDWIQTRSGRKFFPLAPRVLDVEIEDIAHHLSHICRFTGAVREFYSVAEHSIRVSRRVYQLSGGDIGLSLWGLMHDASEAYLSDVASPVKHQPEFAEYRKIEYRLQRVICNRFELPPEEPGIVRIADMELLATEARDLMNPLHAEWKVDATPLPDHIHPWSPDMARRMFLDRFRDLTAIKGAW